MTKSPPKMRTFSKIFRTSKINKHTLKSFILSLHEFLKIPHAHILRVSENFIRSIEKRKQAASEI